MQPPVSLLHVHVLFPRKINNNLHNYYGTSFLLYRQNIFASCNKILVLWFNRFPRFLLSYNFSHDFKTIYWVSYKLCVRIISGVSRNFLILQYVNKCVAHACILYFLCNKAIPIQCRKKLGTGLISSTL